MNEFAPGLDSVSTKAHAADRSVLGVGPEIARVIVPQKGWRALDLKEMFEYRELLWVLVVRDLKVRYRQTVLGFTWAIIQPVMMMVIFSVFFGRLARMPSDNLPYPIFVYAGLLPWMFFAGAITASSNSIVGSVQLVSKVYFPRLLIPLSAIAGILVDFLVASSVLLLMMAYYGIGWGVNLLFAPFLLMGVVLIALGAGALLSALTTTYRDFRYVVPFLLQFWMFATPVVYPASLVPPQWRWALFLNPMAGVIDGFRSAFLGRDFDWTALGVSFLIAILLFLIGIACFERMERRFADIV
jgi:lipopolysaccharide transport system permease protein